ncbi:FAD-dependent oxidoreductase [Sinomonas sp.]|jgi:flavin-dependent dehydrogenase|uniref:FAD-dependent oxidoreductase n=1 Tax=Sinomonas sp. TaxID=1914986 RepID=UPI002FE3CD7A
MIDVIVVGSGPAGMMLAGELALAGVEATVVERRLATAGFIPCWIDQHGIPHPHGDDETGRRVAAYVEKISRAEGFDTGFEWKDGKVQVLPPA